MIILILRQVATISETHHSSTTAQPVVTSTKTSHPPPPPPRSQTIQPAAAAPVTVFRNTEPSSVSVTAAAPVVNAAPISSTDIQPSKTNTSKGPVYGLDAELAKKQKAKYDPELERKAIDWIVAVTRISKPLDSSFSEWLHDGVVLCQLLNNIRSGSISKINSSSMPFKQMENITSFLRCCRSVFNVPEADLFETVDLYEDKDMNNVVRCIFSLGRSLHNLRPPYSGPTLDLTSNH